MLEVVVEREVALDGKRRVYEPHAFRGAVFTGRVDIEGRIQARDRRGTRPYDPAMMVALLLYGYCVGVFSSRKIERASFEDVAFRVLAGGQHPDHSRIAAFRKDHLKALRSFFVQVLMLCQQAGMVKLGHVAIDGTKVQANASKHKAMSYERILQTELRRRWR